MKYFVSAFVLFILDIVNGAYHWDHSVDLNDDFRMLWYIREQEITFEIQVRTLGYVGLGFSRDGKIFGSDIAIGWVDQGQAHFQVSFIKLEIICFNIFLKSFIIFSLYNMHKTALKSSY